MTNPGTQYPLFELAESIPLEHTAPESTSRRFSDYVVYVDESGDHSLASIDADYPVFVLAHAGRQSHPDQKGIDC